MFNVQSAVGMMTPVSNRVKKRMLFSRVVKKSFIIGLF